MFCCCFAHKHTHTHILHYPYNTNVGALNSVKENNRGNLKKIQKIWTNFPLFVFFFITICVLLLNLTDFFSPVACKHSPPLISASCLFLSECALVAPLRLGSASRRSFKAPRGAAKFKDASPPFVLIALLGGTLARFSSLCPPSISVNRTSGDFEGKTVAFCFCLLNQN